MPDDTTQAAPQPAGQEERRDRRRTDFHWGNCSWCNAVTKFWDWIDDRNIDQHVVCFIVLWGTWKITHWAMDFAAAHPTMTGAEMAMIIGAVLGPYSILQGAVIKWYFARTNE